MLCGFLQGCSGIDDVLRRFHCLPASEVCGRDDHGDGFAVTMDDDPLTAGDRRGAADRSSGPSLRRLWRSACGQL